LGSYLINTFIDVIVEYMGRDNVMCFSTGWCPDTGATCFSELSLLYKLKHVDKYYKTWEVKVNVKTTDILVLKGDKN
jgi:hypothetical protein